MIRPFLINTILSIAGAEGRNRTAGLRITNALLCQLSYFGFVSKLRLINNNN